MNTGKSNFVTGQLTYKINQDWAIRYYAQFNVDKSAVEQQCTIYRDLHCWVAEFTVTKRKNLNEVDMFLIFRLKAFPALSLGLQRNYSDPSFSSIRPPETKYTPLTP